MLKRIIKRSGVFLFIMCLLFIAGALPVSAEGEKEGQSVQEVTLTFWQPDIWDYTPALQSYVNSVDIQLKINIQSIPIGEYSDKLRVAFASGDVPDLLIFPNWLIPEYSHDDGLFTDLNKLDAAGVSELKRTLTSGVWGTVNPANRQSISFVPLNTDPSVWFYRKDLFRQAGLPSDPVTVASKLKTWKAVDAIGKSFKTKTKRSLFGDPADVFDAILVQKSPVYYDSKGTYIGDKNPQIKKAYDYVVKGLKEGWIGRYEQGSNAYKKALKAGSFASMIGNQFTAGEIKQTSAASGNWAVAPLPENKTDGGVFSGGIPANAANPDIAFDIIRFLTEEKMQRWAYNELNLFPSSLAALSDKDWLNRKDPFFGNQQLNSALAQSVKTAKPYSLYAESNPAPTAYRNAIQQLIRNAKANPAKLWTTAIKNAKTQASKH